MNKLKFPIILLILILSTIIIFQSCRSNFEFEEIDNFDDSVSIEGIFAAPIINTKLRLFDFVPDGEDSSLWVEVDENDLMAKLKSKVFTK